MACGEEKLKMRIIVFGVGGYYKSRKEKLNAYQQIEIVAFSDNNAAIWGERIDNIQIVSPALIPQIPCEAILIMNSHVQEVRSQLLELGIEQSKIRFWEPFYAEFMQGERKIYQGVYGHETGKKILIISTALNYNGGTLAAVYAAMALQGRGYGVVLAAPAGDENFIEETVDKGITVAICPAFPFIYEKDRKWVGQFDVVMVNVLQMMHSAYACSRICPTLWWIHEPMEVYERVMSKPWNHIQGEWLDNICIYAVSNMAKKNFNIFFADKIRETLCYGIPDVVLNKLSVQEKRKKVVFAIIGNICGRRKGQDVFLEAASSIKNREQAEFWIIGHCFDDTFGRKIQMMVSNISSVKMLGVLSREEIYNIFPQIDVVVCASREETMSITINEGMMFSKACITTENTGVAEYIQDGVNGFVIPTENISALRDRMDWLIFHREEIGRIGEAARRTYEQYFTIDVFGDRLEKALKETERRWKGR